MPTVLPQAVLLMRNHGDKDPASQQSKNVKKALSALLRALSANSNLKKCFYCIPPVYDSFTVKLT
jgi:hypothetical protein